MVTVRFARARPASSTSERPTALFNWLLPAHGGRFLLRVEGTIKVRSDVRFLEEILMTCAGWAPMGGHPSTRADAFPLQESGGARRRRAKL